MSKRDGIMMWVCNKHVKEAVKLLEVPHVQKAPNGLQCLFCDAEAVLNLYYAHKPSKLKKLTFAKHNNKMNFYVKQLS